MYNNVYFPGGMEVTVPDNSSNMRYIVQYIYSGFDQKFDERVRKIAKRQPVNSGFCSTTNTRFANYQFVTELGAKHFVRNIKRLRKIGFECVQYPLSIIQSVVLNSWKALPQLDNNQ